MKENPNQNMQNNQNGGNKELMAFLAERFDMIDKRFDANDQRFDAIDKRFDANNQRFDAIDKRFDINDQRFDSVDKNLVVLQNQFDKKLNAFQDRNILDYKELADLMAGQFEKVYEILNQKPDKSEVEAMIKTEVGRVMDRVVRQNDKIDDGRAEQIGMKRQLGKHEKWFSKVATKVGIKLQPE
jgi:hypothetical protein